MQTMNHRQTDPTTGNGAVPPNPEVVEKPKRRRFPVDYKRRILDKADSCKKPGELGALLRREGLYSSYLSAWRTQRDQGLKPKKRGRKSKTPEQKRVAELEKQLKKAERKNAKLEAKLKQADLIITVQKKVSELLGIPLSQPESDGSDGSDS